MAGQRDKFTAFLTKKQVKVICEVCAANSWAIPMEGQGLLASVMIHQPGGGLSLPMPQIPAFVMVCENCGNIRLHAQTIVDRGA